MKLFLLAVLLAFFGGSLGAISYGSFSHPDHPGKCVHKDAILSPGEKREFSFTEGHCMRLICSKEDGFGTRHTCGVQGVQAPCKLGDRINPDGAYPDCCDRHIICP